MSGGRPTDYTPELAAEICELLSQGKSLRSVCRMDSMPCAASVFLWLRRYPEFSEQYAKAKEESADALVEDILDIADDGTNDWMEQRAKEGEEVRGWKENGEAIQRSRLRVDTRKWIASKLKAKKYGDKLDVEHSGKLSIEQLVADSLVGRSKTGE